MAEYATWFNGWDREHLEILVERTQESVAEIIRTMPLERWLALQAGGSDQLVIELKMLKPDATTEQKGQQSGS